jgi:hypothetical protein
MTRAIRIERPPEITFDASQATCLILGGDLARPMTIASGPARPYLDFAANARQASSSAHSLDSPRASRCPGTTPTSIAPAGGR